MGLLIHPCLRVAINCPADLKKLITLRGSQRTLHNVRRMQWMHFPKS
jgi:hypothetical protein